MMSAYSTRKLATLHAEEGVPQREHVVVRSRSHVVPSKYHVAIVMRDIGNALVIIVGNKRALISSETKGASSVASPCLPQNFVIGEAVAHATLPFL